MPSSDPRAGGGGAWPRSKVDGRQLTAFSVSTPVKPAREGSSPVQGVLIFFDSGGGGRRGRQPTEVHERYRGTDVIFLFRGFRDV